MSIVRRLYNVARGKVIAGRSDGPDPALADEPPAPTEPAAESEPEPVDEAPKPKPAPTPRPRRL